MTAEEMDNMFDVLYNNITSNQAPGLNAYEKSIFLTKAQDEILKNYFNPKSKGNLTQEGFDGNPKRQVDFSSLMKIKSINVSRNDDAIFGSGSEGNKTCVLPDDILFIVNEQLTVDRKIGNTIKEDLILQVIPISHDEYSRLMSKPYKRPLKYQAWRIINDNPSTKGVSADLIAGPTDTLSSYEIRYVKRPNPIIVGNLDGLTIEGEEDVCNCELDPILHEEILQRAVELAKAAWTSTGQDNLQAITAVGQRSE